MAGRLGSAARRGEGFLRAVGPRYLPVGLERVGECYRGVGACHRAVAGSCPSRILDSAYRAETPRCEGGKEPLEGPTLPASRVPRGSLPGPRGSHEHNSTEKTPDIPEAYPRAPQRERRQTHSSAASPRTSSPERPISRRTARSVGRRKTPGGEGHAGRRRRLFYS
jgi:hypothetical protein